MKQSQPLRLAYAALMAALIFAGTQFLRIPLPFGYFHCGDCFVLLAALLLGQPHALAAAALGSALADIVSGYVIYVPATLVIKGIMSLLFTAAAGKRLRAGYKLLPFILGAAAAEAAMVLGYFVCDALLYQPAGALASLPGNLLQGIVAVITSSFMFTALRRTGWLERNKI